MDSEARIVACLHGAVTDLGLASRTRDELKDVIGLGLREAALRLFPTLTDAELQQFVERYRHHFLVSDPTPSALFPGVAEMLRGLREQGYLLAVATGKGRRGLDQSISQSGLTDIFHATRTAEETVSKPHPQMLLEIIEELDVPRAATLMIGDTEYDMQMARNAGTPALAVSYGVHARERLLQHDPLHCLAEARELISWLEQD